VDRSRLESFSDGVFAVAITLLALDLAVEGPGPGHPSLLSQLGHHWPAFVAYLISFFTIGVIWVNHHAVMSNVVAVSRSLLFINLVLLAVVVAIPFVTSTMSAYLAGGGQNAHVAAALYAGVFELMSISFALLFEWILRHDDSMRQPLPAAAKTPARLRFYAGQIPYLIAIAVGFVSAPATVVITALVAIYYIFERTRPAPQEPPAPDADAE
jgi:uncharacterized membrane protein